MKKNFDRNAELYDLWKNGHTIDEASEISRIPRSTIGYYFKKFKKHEKKGNIADFMDFRKKINSKKEQDEKIQSIRSKQWAEDMIIMAILHAGDTGNWVNTYYCIKTIEFIMNSKDRYLITDEERKIVFEDTLKRIYDYIKSIDTTSENIERIKNLQKMYRLAKKKT